MICRSIKKLAILACLLVSVTVTKAQDYGLMEDLAALAKQRAWMKKMAENPIYQEAMEKLHEQFSGLTSEEMLSKLQEATKSLASAEDMIARKQEFLSKMKETGLLPEEVIEELGQKPELFEEAMKAAFDGDSPISQMVANPELIQSMMREAMDNQEK